MTVPVIGCLVNGPGEVRDFEKEAAEIEATE
jgi:4-hydroxy-3-methylbut-2-en-1-yl diphosphate synthase IspG/GcpE